MNSLNSENQNNSPLKGCYSILVITVEWMLMGFSHGNNDYLTYKIMYEAVNNLGINQYSGLEIGQRALYRVGGILGFTYDQFLSIYVLIALLVLWIGLGYLTNNRGLALTLYFIFPFIYDATQIRNFFALCLMVYAFHFLINKGFFKSVLPFVICVIMAGLIHSIAFFYLIFLLTKIKNIKTLILITIFLSFLIGLFFNFFKSISYTLVANKISIYSSLGTTPFVYMILYAILFFLNIFIMYFTYNMSLKDNDLKLQKIALKGYQASILLITCYPLVIIDEVFFRIFRDFFIITYAIVVLIAGKAYRKFPADSAFIFILTFFYAAINSYVWLFAGGKYSGLVIPIFTNNSIFGR